MHKSKVDGHSVRQKPSHHVASDRSAGQSATTSACPALMTAQQAANEIYGVSERTFHDMRAKGLVPPAIVLGPRLLRWYRAELEAAIAGMPRKLQADAAEPQQLLRGKIERMKASASVLPKVGEL